MQYYAAPMEGLTDRVWRQAQQKWFGPEGTAHRYYAPFLSPPENRVLIKKKTPPCWTPFWMRYSPMRKGLFRSRPGWASAARTSLPPFWTSMTVTPSVN